MLFTMSCMLSASAYIFFCLCLIMALNKSKNVAPSTLQVLLKYSHDWRSFYSPISFILLHHGILNSPQLRPVCITSNHLLSCVSYWQIQQKKAGGQLLLLLLCISYVPGMCFMLKSILAMW